MKKMFKLMANMLAIATFVLVFTSCNEDENNVSSNTVEVSSITVEPKSIYLEVDATQTLTATLLPADTSTDSIIWSTYNKEVATIRPTGALTAEITGVSIGTTTITIVTSNNKSALCEVTVSKTVPLVDITVKPTGPLHLESGIRQQIIATQGPANATNYHPVWTSSDPDVVSVEGNGIIFTEGAGTAIITVTSGTVSKNIEILVTDPLSSITITPEGPLNLTEIGTTAQLTATPVPESPLVYNPVWSSTNPNVVTVTETGFVTAINAGIAKIIVASDNIADTVDVKVTLDVLYLVGSANPESDPIVLPKSNGQYKWSGILKAGGFKFLYSPDEDLPSLNKGADNNTLVERNSASQSDDLFTAEQGGLYTINIDKENLTIQYRYVKYYFEELYPVGDATTIGWSLGNAVVLWDDNNPGIYIVYEGPLTSNDSGEFKIHTDHNWGGCFRPMESNGSITSTDVQYTLNEAEKGDLKWKVKPAEVGNYRITLDVIEMKIYFEKLS